MTIGTIMGQRGTGKSTLFRGLCGQSRRLIVIDAMGEHMGLVERHFLDDSPALAKHFSRPRRHFRVAFSPDPSGGEFNACCRAAWGMGGLLLAVDEIDQYATAGQSPPALLRLLRLGRHRAISMIATVRRPADIPRAWTAASDSWYLFRVVEPRDLRYMTGVIGTYATLLPALPDFRFLYWNPRRPGIVKGKVNPGGRIAGLQAVA